MIYVDNSATSFFKPKEMIEAVSNYLMHPGNPGRGIGQNSFDASRMILDTRIKIAEFFDFKPINRVIFTSGITESLNMVIQGLITSKDHVITSIYEHNAVLRPLYHKTSDISFFQTIDQLDKLKKENTKALILNHISNVTGDIMPLHEIGKWCHDHGILFIVDSAQSAGILEISCKKDYIDILCFTGHKGLLGMQGTGGFCLSKNIDLPSFKFGGTGSLSFEKAQPDSYPDHLEAGTLNVPGIIGLSYSLDYISQQGIKNIYEHERNLAKTFYEGIKDIEGVIIYGNFDQDFNHAGIISINIENMDGAILADKLHIDFGIETRAGAHCAPLIHEHYHTTSQVRFSFGINNTLEDVKACIKAVKQIAKENHS